MAELRRISHQGIEQREVASIQIQLAKNFIDALSNQDTRQERLLLPCLKRCQQHERAKEYIKVYNRIESRGTEQ